MTGKHSKRVESSQTLLHDNFFSADPTVLPSVANTEPGVEGAVIKLTPGAGAVITNYGSGSCSGSTTLDLAIEIVRC